MVEHQITLSNLNRLIFGSGDRTTKQQDKSPKAEQNNTAAEESETSPSNDESHEPKEAKDMDAFRIRPTSMQPNTLFH
ncbi:hypothetical protein [Legionella sp. WA2024007413]